MPRIKLSRGEARISGTSIEDFEIEKERGVIIEEDAAKKYFDMKNYVEMIRLPEKNAAH